MAVNKVLGQTRPPTADTFVEIYQCPASTAASSMILTIANVSGADTTYQISHDDAGGSSPGVGFAIAWDVPIATDAVLRVQIPPLTAGGELAVSSGVNNSCVFTLHGTETLVA